MPSTTEAYIVDSVRLPVGKRGGSLGQEHPADLGAAALTALIRRTGIDDGAVDDVLFGCLDQIGPQALNVARTAWLSAGLAERVPATTIDRQCGSSQQAVHFAAQGVRSGDYDLVVAGGVQSMSVVPMGSSVSLGEQAGFGGALDGAGWKRRYGDQEISQFRGAELIAQKWDIGRAEMERFALESHRRATDAWQQGRFDREVVPYGDVTRDEGYRSDTSLEKMAALPTLRPDGRLTAAVSSQMSDGAAALLLASTEAADEHGLTPKARVHTTTVIGADPVYMLTGPIAATQRVLERAGLGIDDIDLFECNEAFAPVVIVWARETGAPLALTNVNGGAIALGHPLGATGARLMTTLLHALETTGGRFGLQTMCEGGGTANATIVERL